MKVLLTGGAGFIGLQWAKRLVGGGHQVVVLDNLSAGIKPVFPAGVRFIKGDVRNEKDIQRAFEHGPFGRIDHLAADPYVKESAERPRESFENNVVGTLNMLEAARKNSVPRFLFTSTSTVYGRAKRLPTPEDAALAPISNYGASKAAAECYVMSYARTYGIRAYIFRLANITGPTSNHGVIPDFKKKLLTNPDELEILGDGTQKKSYLDIEECLSYFELALSKSREQVNVFNIGSDSQMSVVDIADEICEQMKLPKKPKYRFSGTKRGGWVGDVEDMLLDIRKIKELK